jgi:hypothetical protein
MRQTKEQSLMTDMTVARTILDQLGGARFVAMTGAREFVGSAKPPRSARAPSTAASRASTQ